MWRNSSETWTRDFIIQSGICKIVGEHVFGDPSPATNDRHTTALKTKAFTLQQIRKISNGKPNNFQMHFPIWWNFTCFLLGFCVFLYFSPRFPHFRCISFVSKRQAVWRFPGKDVFMSCGGGGAKAAKEAKNPAFRAFQEKDQMEPWWSPYLNDVRWSQYQYQRVISQWFDEHKMSSYIHGIRVFSAFTDSCQSLVQWV